MSGERNRVTVSDEFPYEFILELCEEYSLGGSVMKMCEGFNVSLAAFYRQVREDDIHDIFKKAREIRLSAILDETMDIARNVEAKGAEIKKAKLIIATMFGYISKVNPKRYGHHAGSGLGGGVPGDVTINVITGVERKSNNAPKQVDGKVIQIEQKQDNKAAI